MVYSYLKVKVLISQLCPTLWDPMHCSLPGSSPCNSPGKNTGVGCHSFLQTIFLTQGLNPSLQHCRQILYHLSHLEFIALGLTDFLPSHSARSFSKLLSFLGSLISYKSIQIQYAFIGLLSTVFIIFIGINWLFIKQKTQTNSSCTLYILIIINIL